MSSLNTIRNITKPAKPQLERTTRNKKIYYSNTQKLLVNMSQKEEGVQSGSERLEILESEFAALKEAERQPRYKWMKETPWRMLAQCTSTTLNVDERKQIMCERTVQTLTAESIEVAKHVRIPSQSRLRAEQIKDE